jgi:hypothetical protein
MDISWTDRLFFPITSTGPAPLLGPPGKFAPHRIAFDIVKDGQKMIVLLNRKGLEATLPDVVPALFASFPGTMELSDSPATCLSDLWRCAFSDRSAAMGAAEATGVSRLP